MINLPYEEFSDDKWEFKRDSDKIYIDEISVDDLDDIVKFSKLKDKESKIYYEKMLDDFEHRYKGKLVDMQEEDKLQFAARFINDEECKFFVIRLGDKTIGEMYAYQWFENIFFNILLDKPYRNQGYGIKVIEELKKVAFLYRYTFKECNSLLFDTMKGYDEIGDFFIKCGFAIDTEFSMGYRRLIYTQEMYEGLVLVEPTKDDYKSYDKYMIDFNKTKFPKSFKKFYKKSINDKLYKYIFLKKEDELIGIGKYLKKNKIYKDCVYIEIKPEYRKKGYGVMFLHNIYLKMLNNSDDYGTIMLKAHWKNRSSVNLIRKAGGDIKELYIGNKIIFLITFIYR